MTDSRTQLGDLVIAHYGSALKEADRNVGGGHVVYGSNGEVGRHDRALVEFPTVIVGRKGSVGAVTYAPEGGWPIDTTFYLEVRHSDRVHLRYLYWALAHARLDQRGITTSIPGLNRDELYRTRIRLPPLREQRRIAAVLDKADVVRRRRRESIRLLHQLLPSAFLEMFGDPVKHPRVRDLPSGWRLVAVDEIKAQVENACSGGPFGSSLTRSDYVPNPGVPVIRGNNLVSDQGVFRDEDFVFVSEAKAEELGRNHALPGDIVFTQRGTLGQVAQIPRAAQYPRYVISQSQMKLTVNERLADPTYVVHYFLSSRAKLDLASRTLATGVPHINLSILKGFPFVLPPLALQRRFADLVVQCNVVGAMLVAAGRRSDQLFDSLVQRAFRGQGVDQCP